MNDAEKRRKRLLNETRMRYRDVYDVPAVHPRYRSAYTKLYQDNSGKKEGEFLTFGMRLFLAVLLFAAYVMMDYQDTEIAKVDSERIVTEIQCESGLESVLTSRPLW